MDTIALTSYPTNLSSIEYSPLLPAKFAVNELNEFSEDVENRPTFSPERLLFSPAESVVVGPVPKRVFVCVR